MGNNKKRYLLGIDLGGTKVLIGIMDKKFRILKRVKLEMDGNKGEKFFFNNLVDGIEEVLEEAGTGLNNISMIGIGCPGIIDVFNGVVKISSNVSFFKNYPLVKKLKAKLKVPILLENDANAALYGEQQFGAAHGYRQVVGSFSRYRRGRRVDTERPSLQRHFRGCWRDRADACFDALFF